MKKIIIFCLAVALVLTGCTTIEPADQETSEEVTQTAAHNLLTGSTYDELMDHLRSAQQKHRPYSMWRGGLIDGDMESDRAEGAPSAGVDDQADFSTTNIQVAGVDEADIIKTDGTYLYLVANQSVYLIDASDPANLAVVSKITFQGFSETDSIISSESPVELFVDAERDRLTLIVSGYKGDIIRPEPMPEPITDDIIWDEEPDEPDEPVVTETPADSEESAEPAESDESAGSADIFNTTDDTVNTDDTLDSTDIAAPAAIIDSDVSENSASSDAPVSSNGSGEVTVDQPEPDTDREIVCEDIWYTQDTTHFVTTYVYDITSRSEPVLLRQFSQEGGYVTARRIEEAVYVISQEYQYWIMRDFPMPADGTASRNVSEVDEDTCEETIDHQTLLPAVTEKDVLDEWQTLAPADIAIVPNGDISQQMTISAINTVRTDLSPDVLAVIGSAGVVYASSQYIYVAAWQMDDIDETSDDTIRNMPPVNTEIFRYQMGDATVRAAGQGKVPGSLINQFAMDESNGYFRIATTTGTMWDDQDPSKNHVYVLDSHLKLTGQVNDLAPGEQIKSVRFMGDQAYVVTFRTIDPLFVLDLSQPSAPKVLGELKIPGYSTYLHPYAEHMLLGFGYDVIEADENTAYHGGLKVAMFDISDFSNPREHDTLILGDSGSYSELLYNHKALFLDRNRQTIAFPAMLSNASATPEGDRVYSAPYFQGLVVLQVTDQFNLVQKALLTHTTQTSDEKYPYSQIQRAASIGDTLFAVSPRLVRAYDMTTFEPTGEVELPGYNQPWS